LTVLRSNAKNNLATTGRIPDDIIAENVRADPISPLRGNIMATRPFSLRGLWKQVMLRHVHYRNRHEQLDMLYRIEDPWDLDSARERFRFEETNRLIQREFGHVASLLEVGCGEGHQSRYLAQVCDRLHGYDVSARAVERARKRCPSSTFSVGALSDIPDDGVRRFDLVVACEVLYYIKDVRAAIQAMSRLGASCLLTYYQTQQEHLDRTIIPLQLGGRSVISNGDDTWIAVWWRNK
jgi:SAM-dependent methyltransferase